MSKSYVTMEQKVCDVCGEPYDTGSILMDRRLKDTFEHNTITGYGLCPEHEKLYNEGYIALVECNNSGNRAILNRPEAFRTGQIAHIRGEVFCQIFNVDKPNTTMVFVEVGVIDKIKSMMGEQNEM